MITLLLKASFILAILLAFYKLFLEQESFFANNRAYLLGCLVLTFALPSVVLPEFINDQGVVSTVIEKYIEPSPLAEATKPLVIPNKNQKTTIVKEKTLKPLDVKAGNQKNNPINPEKTISTTPIATPNQVQTSKSWLYWLTMIYGFGVVIFSLNFLTQIASILWKALKSEDKIEDLDCIIINSSKVTEPCSFFKYIFINPESYDYDTYEQILAHERIHVGKWHTLDLLLSEIAVIILWFNPLVWLFRKEVEKNIEFQTDDLLLNGKTVEKEQYQMNLLKVATYQQPLAVTTNYNQSLIKQRIIKMSGKKSNTFSYWKYAFIAPLVFMTLLLVNKPIAGIAQTLGQPAVLVSDNIENNTDEKEIGEQVIKSQKIKEESQSTLVSIKNEQLIITEKTTGLIEKIAKDNSLEHLTEAEQQEVESILENAAQPMKTAELNSLSELQRLDILRDLADLGDNGAKNALKNLSEFGFTIDYSISGLSDDSIFHFSFDNLTLEERLDAMKVLNTYDNLPETIKGNTYQVFSRYSNLDKSTVFAVMQGLKTLEDFEDVSTVNQYPKKGQNDKMNQEETGGKEDPECLALIRSIQAEDLTKVKELLKTVDPSCIYKKKKIIQDGYMNSISYEDMMSPLVAAVNVNNREIIELLVKAKADINGDVFGEGTPLIAAVNAGNMELVEYFIAKKAKLNIDSYGIGTAIIAAASNGDMKMVKYLRGKGARLNKDSYGIGTTLIAATRAGNLPLVKYFVDEKAELNTDSYGIGTALIAAVRDANWKLVEYLVEKGANLNIDSYGEGTALMVAIENEDKKIVEYLLSKGASLDIDSYGIGTTLIAAIVDGNEELAKFCVERGANLNINSYGIGTALSVAAGRKDQKMMDYLLSKGASLDMDSYGIGTILIAAVEDGNDELVKFCVEKGANLNIDSYGIGTALHVAIEKGNKEMTEYLISKGASLDIDSYGIGTILIAAVAGGNKELARFCVEKGANLNIDSYGIGTALIAAASKGDIKMVRYLIANGANKKIDSYGLGTALAVAAENGHDDIVKFLRSNGRID